MGLPVECPDCLWDAVPQPGHRPSRACKPLLRGTPPNILQAGEKAHEPLLKKKKKGRGRWTIKAVRKQLEMTKQLLPI